MNKCYNNRKYKGLCTKCAKNPSLPTRFVCEPCRAARCEASRLRRASGKCPGCLGDRDSTGTICKKCKEKRLAKKFRLTLEELRTLFKEAEQKCSVCKTPENLVIDHCHKTNKIRGVICKQCNISLGGSKDKIETLFGLIKYLENPPANKILYKKENYVSNSSSRSSDASNESRDILQN